MGRADARHECVHPCQAACLLIPCSALILQPGQGGMAVVPGVGQLGLHCLRVSGRRQIHRTPTHVRGPDDCPYFCRLEVASMELGTACMELDDKEMRWLELAELAGEL